ncbi:hypothetical protein MKZ38_004138 [Zalerion maritima]|uniref:Uncharacterized protein n=1 Tax=Zalerion maritima TaxID=339359 RepID=A0AAD5WRA8_9PEZI|nr:hypothetical protein MKZ38_004138 [Zalerion maritima]
MSDRAATRWYRSRSELRKSFEETVLQKDAAGSKIQVLRAGAVVKCGPAFPVRSTREEEAWLQLWCCWRPANGEDGGSGNGEGAEGTRKRRMKVDITRLLEEQDPLGELMDMNLGCWTREGDFEGATSNSIVNVWGNRLHIAQIQAGSDGALTSTEGAIGGVLPATGAPVITWTVGRLQVGWNAWR